MPRGRRRSDRPIPAHPYRDTALVYAFMAIVLVLVATLTGGDPVRATLVAVVFFAVATAWSWWRFRSRIQEREAARTAGASNGAGAGSNGSNGRRGSE